MARRQNERAINELLSKNVKRRIRPAMQDRALATFEIAKSLMLQEIEDHPVSRELMDHTSNSKFLSGASGSLFGFMGFRQGETPVEDLIEYLDENVKINLMSRVVGKLDLRLPVHIIFPDQQDLKSSGQFGLPWQSGKTWPVGIETGISGLPYFLSTYDHPASESGEGIQAKTSKGGRLLKVRDSEFKPVIYLSGILERFRKRLIGRKV